MKLRCSSVKREMSGSDDNLDASLNDSFNSLQLSEATTNQTTDSKDNHVLQNVEEWRSRKEAKDKADATEKIQQFKVKITALEKERSSQLFGKKNEFRKEFCELEEQEVKLSTDRAKEKEAIKSKLLKISSNVKRFQQEIDGPKNTPDFLEKLKMIMEDIEGSILKYKQQQGSLYEEMMLEERQLHLDLENFEKKIQTWSTASNALSTQTKSKFKDDQQNLSVPPEVKAFQRFLAQTGGHQGGWDEYDHQAYLKLKKKYKVFDEFVNHSVSEIPTRTREDIIQHDEWYKEYLMLRENKRVAIAKWKDMKESERQEKLQKIEDDVEAERSKNERRREMIETEKKERFAKLEQWKLDKEVQLQETKKNEMKQETEKRMRREEAEQKRREEAKARVDEYKQRKKEEEAILVLARKAREEEEREAKKITEEEQARIKLRDKRMLEDKRRRLEQKEKEKKEKEKRLNNLRSKVEVKVERDPSRLYRMTEGWKERQRVSKEENNGPQLQFQRRAVPTWRQGMS